MSHYASGLMGLLMLGQRDADPTSAERSASSAVVVSPWPRKSMANTRYLRPAGQRTCEDACSSLKLLQ